MGPFIEVKMIDIGEENDYHIYMEMITMQYLGDMVASC